MRLSSVCRSAERKLSAPVFSNPSSLWPVDDELLVPVVPGVRPGLRERDREIRELDPAGNEVERPRLLRLDLEAPPDR